MVMLGYLLFSSKHRETKMISDVNKNMRLKFNKMTLCLKDFMKDYNLKDDSMN